MWTRHGTEKNRDENATLAAQNAALKDEIILLTAENDWLKEQLRLSRQQKYGLSSEQSKYDLRQIQLHDDPDNLPYQEEAPAPEEKTTTVKSHTRRTRLTTDKLPENIPTETVEYTLPDNERDCPECGGELRPIGKETVREDIKIIPAKTVLVKHVRTSYGCRCCEVEAETPTIIKAPMPEPVIKGGFASPEAIAHIMVQKFVMGSPLYRQESELLRQGIGLSRQTMSNWLLKATEDWLSPIYSLFYARILLEDNLMADDTSLPVIKEPGREAQQKSCFWVYRTGWGARHPTVVCEYQPGRHKKYPEAFLNGYKGYLQTDAYAGFQNISENIINLGCFSHARRLYVNALKIIPAADRNGTEAMRGKRYCDALFDIEKVLKDMPADERYYWRLVFAKPVLDEYRDWLLSFANLGKSLFAKAVSYSIEQWTYLTNYLLDGRLELSNNRTERSVKMYVISRKNFLFAYTPRGATASAIIFSVIQTAIENDLDPYGYLTYIFKNAPDWSIKFGPAFAERFLPEAVPESLKAPIRPFPQNDLDHTLSTNNIFLTEKEVFPDAGS